GIEADFAQKLGQALNRRVVFCEVPWSKQIDYLEANRIDVIMSGMSITPARSMRINFTNPYLNSGLSAAFRREKSDMSGLLANILLNQDKRVGFVQNTTGEFFCIQRFTKAQKEGFSSAKAGINALKARKIDVFVHDAPIVWWLAANNEADIVSFPELMNVEPLAWGVGKHNMALLDAINALVTQWEKDGTSEKIIKNWIPSFRM
ncbi:MAG TPA: transporter substrate-binding domain-containing protein, partial [Pontiella sp.]|nr:transporter substrate-binding domain-containing protein [Pontiella sp.]